MSEADPQRWAEAADGWRKLGAQMVMLYPMFRIPDFDEQIEQLAKIPRLARIVIVVAILAATSAGYYFLSYI